MAISGIAERMHHIVQDRRLAGIWKHHFRRSLLWSVEGYYGDPSQVSSQAVNAGRSIAPSWRWASSLFLPRVAQSPGVSVA